MKAVEARGEEASGAHKAHTKTNATSETVRTERDETNGPAVTVTATRRERSPVVAVVGGASSERRGQLATAKRRCRTGR